MLKNIIFLLGALSLSRTVLCFPTSFEEDIFQNTGLPDLGRNLTSHLEIPDSQAALIGSRFNLTDPDAAPGSLGKRDTVDILRYAITINGINAGNVRNWVTNGELFITSRISSSGTQNGANAAEFLLYVGNPAGSPTAGAVRYYTNRYLYRLVSGAWGVSRLDYAYVTRSGNTYRILPDSRIAAANQLSVFTQTSGLLASIFLVDSGEMVINVASDRRSISGYINFGGRGFIFPGRGVERGRISGRLTGSGRRTF